MIVQGQTRLVIIIGNYAIKIPNFLKGYRQFLYGLVSNHQEVIYQKLNPYFMPIVFKLPFDLIIVMPKAKILDKNLSQNEFNQILKTIGDYPRVDYKPDSFGIWKDQIYIIDYGTTI